MKKWPNTASNKINHNDPTITTGCRAFFNRQSKKVTRYRATNTLLSLNPAFEIVSLSGIDSVSWPPSGASGTLRFDDLSGVPCGRLQKSAKPADVFTPNF
ncbi:hypothetical protein [Lacticaseibacillus manihotivorans]|uniref:Uncharacterized protein n=1 Tax=Lacticaseibacillus manihotivorans TaxID=88233 RepID=A0A5P8JRJ2_9LACO|nr:hypothetical protein [Lacticaseibacillus manihotivorans]QFQ91865.1 hypothetical protein LM010_10710 [Lacticaseibacillus manihotivorans]